MLRFKKCVRRCTGERFFSVWAEPLKRFTGGKLCVCVQLAWAVHYPTSQGEPVQSRAHETLDFMSQRWQRISSAADDAR